MDDPGQIKGFLWLTSGLIFLEITMNLQLVYRFNLRLSKTENMFGKKKIGKQKQNDQKKKISYRGSRTLGLNV